MFRRAKLMLDPIGAATLASANEPGRRLVATVDLTDEPSGPRCARVREPALAFTVE
jgi:hypothetical protein